jgi:hypothetical protein
MSLPAHAVLLNNFKIRPKFIAMQKTAFQNPAFYKTEWSFKI